MDSGEQIVLADEIVNVRTPQAEEVRTCVVECLEPKHFAAQKSEMLSIYARDVAEGLTKQRELFRVGRQIHEPQWLQLMPRPCYMNRIHRPDLDAVGRVRQRCYAIFGVEPALPLRLDGIAVGTQRLLRQIGKVDDLASGELGARTIDADVGATEQVVVDCSSNRLVSDLLVSQIDELRLRGEAMPLDKARKLVGSGSRLGHGIARN